LSIVVIGAGEIAYDLVKYLATQKYTDVTIINRTLTKAVTLAGKYDYQTLSWDQLADGVAKSTIVISCVSMTDVIKVEAVHQFHEKYFIDLTTYESIKVPDNYNMENVITLDTFSQMVSTTQEHQHASKSHVQTIIGAEVIMYMTWHSNSILRKSTPYGFLT
jgi:glutamyl-tRNA reductase